MTTITIHRIDVSDLTTFRVRCGKCNQATLIEINGKWASAGGRAKCMHCGVDWENAGIALAGMISNLRSLQGYEPEAIIQIEIESRPA